MMPVVRFITFIFVLFGYCKDATGLLLDNHVNDLDKHKNVSTLITYNKYPLEEHCVLTPDGYILSVIRIPHGRKNKKYNKKGVALLVHGLMADSTCWVFKSPDQSLGFILADEGYDVWLINTRGSTYSKKHIKYKPDEYKFWDFSFDEVAQYDIPTTIDYILNATSEKALYLIGYSQGTSVSFAMLSERPDYNKKVKLLIAMAPVGSIGYSPSTLKYLLPYANEIALTLTLLNFGEFSLNSDLMQFIEKNLCNRHQELCENVFLGIIGVDKPQKIKSGWGDDAVKFLSSTSVKSVLHYAQLMKSQKFRKFDYGYRNMRYYHQNEPPEYDLSRITTPVALISSKNDAFADPKDVDILRKKLKSLVFDYCVPSPYNHADFLLAEDVRKLVYEPILKLLIQY